MADPFIAEIRMFGGNFPPRGWAFCEGQLLPIAQNTALFSLLGTTYGGNGINNFALPDLRGRAPIHSGQGPGLSSYELGETGGNELVTLTPSQLPAHTHAAAGSTNPANSKNPENNVLASVEVDAYTKDGTLVAMHPGSIPLSGGQGSSHNNLQPYLVVSFIIALQGVFPSRG